MVLNYLILLFFNRLSIEYLEVVKYINILKNILLALNSVTACSKLAFNEISY